jgi:hypothetical protein
MSIPHDLNPPDAVHSALTGLQRESVRFDEAAGRIAADTLEFRGNLPADLVELKSAAQAQSMNLAVLREAIDMSDSMVDILA